MRAEYAYGVVRRWFVPLGAAIALAGCATVSGFPVRTSDIATDLKALAPYLGPDALVTYETCAPKRACRNRILEARVLATDLRFAEFEQKLYSQGIGFGVGTDWLTLALNGIGSVSSHSAKSLSAAAAGVTGAKASFEKDALYNKTMPILLAQMAAKRKEVLARIRTGENEDEAAYPLLRGLNDLEDYYQAGSLPGALNDIAATTGEQARNAEQKLQALTLVVPVDAATQVRREKVADYLKTKAKPEKLKAFVAASGLTTSDAPLKDALDLLNAAQTESQLGAFCGRYRVIFGEDC